MSGVEMFSDMIAIFGGKAVSKKIFAGLKR
jgi:hypothetical protein